MTFDSTPSATARTDLVLSGVPAGLAEQVQALQNEDPDLLQRILQYGVTRKIVFDTLASEWSGASERTILTSPRP